MDRSFGEARQAICNYKEEDVQNLICSFVKECVVCSLLLYSGTPKKIYVFLLHKAVLLCLGHIAEA